MCTPLHACKEHTHAPCEPTVVVVTLLATDRSLFYALTEAWGSVYLVYTQYLI